MTDVSREEEIHSREEGSSHQEAEERQAFDRGQEGGGDEEADNREAQDGGEEDYA